MVYLCKICGGKEHEIRYRGKIRVGKFGNLSTAKQEVLLCKQCQVCYLNQESLDYESKSYRTLVEANPSVEEYYLAHDDEQLANLSLLNLHNIRDSIIADIGCGAGSFLDLVKGFARSTIAVEPAKHFQGVLVKKGHDTYSYTEKALPSWEGKVDIVTCFAVLEHVADPLQFIADAKKLLKPDGVLLLSTPNVDDWMIDFLPKTYDQFFFRYVHQWYFGADSLKYLAKLAELRVESIEYRQRFDLSNALHWANLGKPTGLLKLDYFSDLDGSYQTILEKKGKSDFVYVKLTQS